MQNEQGHANESIHGLIPRKSIKLWLRFSQSMLFEIQISDAGRGSRVFNPEFETRYLQPSYPVAIFDG